MTMPEQVPSVGQTVHYVSHGTPIREDGSQAFTTQCRAATITEVAKYLTHEPFDGCPNGTNGMWLVGLAVTNPTGMLFQSLDGGGCLYGAEGDDLSSGGTWHWPERV